MASAEVKYEPGCSICQNIYTDLMTLNCGHDFCRECITKVLDTQEKNEYDYSCPKCRKRFRSRPELQRFQDFSNSAEKFESGLPGKDWPMIFCTNCIDSPKLAVKSCLHCETHLCEAHLKVHSTSPEHVLLEPTTDLKARKCSIHNKILEYYCTEDAAYICLICKYDVGHRGHQVDKMEELFKRLKKEKADTERKLYNLYEQNLRSQENQADIIDKVEELFRNIRKRLEDLREKVLNEINRQGEQLPVSNLIQELEGKKHELLCRILHIEELCNVTDQRDWALDGAVEEGPSPQSDHYQQEPFLIPMILHAGLSDIVKMKDNLFPDLHAAGITLDIYTAAKDVQISEDRKSAKSTTAIQVRPRTKGTFPTCRVLSTNTFSSGKHYWVVESSPSGNWAIGICYHSIQKGQGWIGNNEKSWGLKKFYEAYHAQHKGKAQYVTCKIPCNRFGVYVDYEAGRFSIHALSDPVQHLCSFNPTTLTEPLHAVFSVGEDEAQSQLTVL